MMGGRAPLINFNIDLLRAVKAQIPIFAPNQESTYSNVAFELLGVVLERVTGQDYKSYIETAIFEPLGMNKSTLSLPPDSAGVIPSGDQFWDVDVGIQAPTGGIYSSSKDLSTYLRYILGKYNGLTHALNWFNPVSPARGVNSFYGMPWEIYHTDRLLSKSGRNVRFITKSGGLPGYSSIIIMAPEYDLGFIILVAGNHDLTEKLKKIVTSFVRAAEKLAVRQLQARYAGTYSSSNPNLNTSVNIIADHRGLVLTRFISNSSDILNSAPLESWIPQDSYAQIIPTLLYRNAKDQKGEEWRIQPVEERLNGEHEIWDDFCITDVDGPLYAAVPMNNVVFWDQGEKGTFETIELSAFRVTLTRVHDESLIGEDIMEL